TVETSRGNRTLVIRSAEALWKRKRYRPQRKQLTLEDPRSLRGDSVGWQAESPQQFEGACRNVLALKALAVQSHSILLKLSEAMGYAGEHLEAEKKIEVPPPKYKIPLRGKSLEHFGGTNIKSGVKYSIVLANGKVLPTLDGPVPERNMRHGIAYSA